MDELNDISVETDFSSYKFTEIKVDLKTPLEKAFWWLTTLSVVAFVIALIISPGEKYDMQWHVIMAFAGVGSVLFCSLYFFTDNYYIFNFVNKKVFYHFKFFFYTKVEFVANFADIHAVTSTGKAHSDKSDGYYTYRVQCVLNTGQILDLSDETLEELERQNRIARKIASITGAKYVEGLAGCHAVAKRAGDKLSFDHYQCSWMDLTKTSFLEVGAVVAFIAVFSVIGRYSAEIIQSLKLIFGLT
ncbi:MAG TPA: hypothetical protein PLM07_04335 [Candidatus Rifleibacterium sp.]|nr:hypothetical protein [Candidatus Rifleibacterium sp.]HPT45113.1 hypothetical protein [Candidatus Rifleibacterium sp.]